MRPEPCASSRIDTPGSNRRALRICSNNSTLNLFWKRRFQEFGRGRRSGTARCVMDRRATPRTRGRRVNCGWRRSGAVGVE